MKVDIMFIRKSEVLPLRINVADAFNNFLIDSDRGAPLPWPYFNITV